MSFNDDTITVSGRIIHETTLAILVQLEDDPDGDPVWLPFSQISHLEEPDDPFEYGDIDIPEWLAQEKGLA